MFQVCVARTRHGHRQYAYRGKARRQAVLTLETRGGSTGSGASSLQNGIRSQHQSAGNTAHQLVPRRPRRILQRHGAIWSGMGRYGAAWGDVGRDRKTSGLKQCHAIYGCSLTTDRVQRAAREHGGATAEAIAKTRREQAGKGDNNKAAQCQH